MCNCNIRIAENRDAEIIADVGRRAFTQAYGKFNSPADLQMHLENTYALSTIREVIDGAEQLYLIAALGETPAGFAKLRRSHPPSCVPESNSFEIHQIYVLTEFQGRGVGRQLMDALSAQTRSQGGDGIYLGVWERAPWAIAFYEKYGMAQVGQHVFRLG